MINFKFIKTYFFCHIERSRDDYGLYLLCDAFLHSASA